MTKSDKVLACTIELVCIIGMGIGLYNMCCSPSLKKEYTIKYAIYWSNDSIEVKTFKNSEGYALRSGNGANGVWDYESSKYTNLTIAPIRVISYLQVTLKRVDEESIYPNR